jgi:SAM-dependent methyltransferase
MQDRQYFKKVNNYGFVSADPIPSQKELEEFYRDTYYQNPSSSTYQESYSEEEEAWKKLRAKHNIFAIESLKYSLSAAKKFLDVGCGEGFMLSAAQQSGWDAVGMDFSGYAVKQFNSSVVSRVRVGNAYELLDAAIIDGEKYSACSLLNILEHVVEPTSLLLKIKKLLLPGGVALITVPNDFSLLQAKLLELKHVEREYWFGPPSHLHYFNTDNLPKFLGSLDFKLIDCFGDFPIELFLFHPGSNYSMDRTKGKSAHNARLTIDLLIAEHGIEAFHTWSRALATSGICRNVTCIVQVRE